MSCFHKNVKRSSMLLLSIITVVFNGEKEIERTIRSVVEQNNKTFEFIIIDGCSTDSTMKIVERYKDKIDVIVSERDKGIYDAMNKAIGLSNGKWLYFLNCGDYFVDPFVLENVSSDIKDSSNNLHVYKVAVVDRNDKIIDNFPRTTDCSTYRHLFYSRFSHQAIFAKKEDYEKAGKFDLNFKVYSDFYTISKILKSGIIAVHHSRVITAYNNLGVSNDWKNVIALSKEREIILSLLDEDFSGPRFIAAIFKAYVYFLKKYLQRNG